MKKRKCVEESTESEVTVDDETCRAGPSVTKTPNCTCKSKSFRSYHDSLWFTCSDEFGSKPKCVICGNELSTEYMVPRKRKDI